MLYKILNIKHLIIFKGAIYLLMLNIIFASTPSENTRDKIVLNIKTEQGIINTIVSDENGVTSRLKKPNPDDIKKNIHIALHKKNEELVEASNYEKFIEPICSSHLNLILVKIFTILEFDHVTNIARQNKLHEFFYLKHYFLLNPSILKFKSKYPLNTPEGDIPDDDEILDKFVAELVELYITKYDKWKDDEEETVKPLYDYISSGALTVYENVTVNPINVVKRPISETDITKYYNILSMINAEILDHDDTEEIQTQILNIVNKFKDDNDIYTLFLGFMNHQENTEKYEHFHKFLFDFIMKSFDKLQPQQNFFNINFSENDVFDKEFDFNIQKLVKISKEFKNDNLFGNMRDLEQLTFIQYMFGDDMSLKYKEIVLASEAYSLFVDMQKQRLQNIKPTILIQALTDIVDFINFIIKNKLAMAEEAEICEHMIVGFVEYMNHLESVDYETNDSYKNISSVTSIKILSYSIEIQCNLIIKFLRYHLIFYVYEKLPNLSLVGANAYIKLKAYVIFMRNAFLADISYFSAIADFIQAFGQIKQEPSNSYMELQNKLRDNLNSNLILNRILNNI